MGRKQDLIEELEKLGVEGVGSKVPHLECQLELARQRAAGTLRVCEHGRPLVWSCEECGR
jgi:hypothetical protein